MTLAAAIGVFVDDAYRSRRTAWFSYVNEQVLGGQQSAKIDHCREILIGGAPDEVLLAAIRVALAVPPPIHEYQFRIVRFGI